MALFQTSKDRYLPATGGQGYADVDQRKLARVVGGVALLLPAVLWLATRLPGDNPLIDTCFRTSLSHFYYAPLWGTVFTGALCFIGAYLCVYKGEDVHDAEDRLATWAGLGCFGVALFPTSGWGCNDLVPFSARPMQILQLSGGTPAPTRGFDPETAFRLFEYAHILHYVSAGIVFFFLAWFCFFVFTAIDPSQRDSKGNPKPVKMLRNALYYFTGGVIVVAIIAMGSSLVIPWLTGTDWPWWDANNLTFWAEAAALAAFGVSWLVKGRFLGFLED